METVDIERILSEGNSLKPCDPSLTVCCADIERIESGALAMQFVQVGRFDPWITVLAHRSVALVVSNHENDVGLGAKRQFLRKNG